LPSDTTWAPAIADDCRFRMKWQTASAVSPIKRPACYTSLQMSAERTGSRDQDLVTLEQLEASAGNQEATCHLLDRLTRDLATKVESLGLPFSQEIHAAIGDVIGRYSSFLCQEKPQLESLRRFQTELQSAIDRKEQFLAHILKDSADAIFTVDADDRIVIWNKGAEAIFGFREEEIVGQRINRLLPSSREYELRQIKDQTRRFGAVNNRLTQWRTREGKSIQVILTCTAIRGKERYAGSSFVIKDVTRQRDLEEVVRQAEHFSSIGRLAAGLAHEIKNPLAGIQGAIEVIRDRSASEFEQDVLSQVLSEVGRIDKIVRDLLNYAKPKNPELKPVSLEPIIRRLITLLQESGGRDVDFVIKGKSADRKTQVLGDENYLEQVFMNLLLNSLEAMGGKGTVTLSFQAEPHMLTVRIHDSGPGVPIGYQSRIFDPFFTTKQSGTGLGLATCRRILLEHGGTVSLDPDTKEGAAFVVKLPRDDSDEK
jgi:PAS domain S-box-containing protein